MFPKPGNAFAQAKALELERQRNSRDATQLTPNSEEAPNVSTIEGNTAHNSLDTTFEMFTGDLPLVVTKSRSPEKPLHQISPSKRAATDPEKYNYAHKSALPDPLFHANPVANLISKFTAKRVSGSKDKVENPPKVPEKDSRDESVNENETEAMTMSTVDRVEEDERVYPAEHSRASSRSSQVSTQSRPRGDPVQAIHEAHDTRYAFTPITNMYQRSLPITPRSLNDSHQPADGIILGPPTINPTRDGKYALTKQAQFVEQSRIPSYAGSIMSAGQLSAPLSAPFASPQLWIGPDGRVYSGPLLSPLTYRPPSANGPVNQNRSSAPYSNTTFSARPGHSSDGSSSVQTPSVYAIAGGGAWEQLQAQYPHTMPLFQGPYARPRASSSATSNATNDVTTSHSSDHRASPDPSYHDDEQDDDVTPRNKCNQGPTPDCRTPSKRRPSSRLTKVTEEDVTDIESQDLTEHPKYPDHTTEANNEPAPPIDVFEGPGRAPPFAGYQGAGSFDEYFVGKFANLDQQFAHLQNQYAVLEGQYANLEQQIQHQYTYWEHSMDHIVDHRLELALGRMRRLIDESSDKLSDKVLSAISNKITGKQTEILDRQNEALQLERALSEQIKLLVQTSVREFEKVEKLEKLSLRSEQNIRVDLSKLTHALQAVRDDRDISLPTSPTKKQEQQQAPSTPELSKIPMRRQVSVGSLANPTSPSSVYSQSPSPTKTTTPKPRKLTPMPGAAGDNSSSSSNKAANPPANERMKATTSSQSISHDPIIPHGQTTAAAVHPDDIGIATSTTTSTTAASSTSAKPAASQRQASDHHHHRRYQQSRPPLDSDPIKKPHPQPSLAHAYYPPAARAAFANPNTATGAAYHHIQPNHHLMRRGNTVFTDQNQQKQEDDKTNTNANGSSNRQKSRVDGGADNGGGKKQQQQAPEVWTAGNWYDRAFGGK